MIIDYDNNGSLTKDLNRGITDIQYDVLGNSKKITFSGNRTIEYLYSSEGKRMRAIHSYPQNPNVTTSALHRDTTDYVCGLILKNRHPESYQFDGGYATFTNDSYSGWHYYVQDYLGSNRLVVNRNGTVEQKTHYYPYGGVIGDISTNESTQKYKFEGKELDRSFGLDNYDIGARQYYAMLPMWDRVDPLAEKYYGVSPYAYCGGDPVNNGDYDGKFSNRLSANTIRYINSQQSGQLAGQVYENQSYNNDNYRYGFNTVQLSEIEGIVVTGHFSASGMDILRGTSMACDYVGTAASTIGYGLLLSGVGTGCGVALSSFGNGLSNGSILCDFAIDWVEQDFSTFMNDLLWTVPAKVLNHHLQNVLPGGKAQFGQEQFNLGTEIIKDGLGLKFNYIQKVFEASSNLQLEEDEEHK